MLFVRRFIALVCVLVALLALPPAVLAAPSPTTQSVRPATPTQGRGGVEVSVTPGASGLRIGHTYTFSTTLRTDTNTTVRARRLTLTLPKGTTLATCQGVGGVGTCRIAGTRAILLLDQNVAPGTLVSMTVAATLSPALRDGRRMTLRGGADYRVPHAMRRVRVSRQVPVYAPYADLGLTATTYGSFSIGSTTNAYIFHLTNSGDRDSAYSPTTLSMLLPPGVRYVGVMGQDWACREVTVNGPYSVLCTYSGNIPVGTDAPAVLVQVAVDATAAPSATATARVALAGDHNDANDSADVSYTLQ